MMLIGYLLTPVYSILDDVEELTIDIDAVHYMKSTYPFSTSGLKLKSDDGQVYYFWYPFGEWHSFSQEVEKELLSGEVTSVTMVVSNKQSLGDRLFHRKRIVDLRNDSSVYYSIDAERVRLKNNYAGALAVVPFLLIFWMGSIFVTGLGYGVVSFRKRKGNTKK